MLDFMFADRTNFLLRCQQVFCFNVAENDSFFRVPNSANANRDIDVKFIFIFRENLFNLILLKVFSSWYMNFFFDDVFPRFVDHTLMILFLNLGKTSLLFFDLLKPFAHVISPKVVNLAHFAFYNFCALM